MADKERSAFFIQLTIGKVEVDASGIPKVNESKKLPLTFDFDSPMQVVLDTISLLVENRDYLAGGKPFDMQGLQNHLREIQARPDRRRNRMERRTDPEKRKKGRRWYDKLERCPSCGQPVQEPEEEYCYECRYYYQGGGRSW